MSSVSNIFLGNAEAPLLIRPYLSTMTNSELHAVMSGGYATIAGSMMAAYITFGISASHLLSASIMSAPAALACSKLMYPGEDVVHFKFIDSTIVFYPYFLETKKSKTTSSDIKIEKGKEANVLDAASQGAMSGVYLVANIAAGLVAVLAFIAFLNGMLVWLGKLISIENLTFENILGKVFIPLAYIMGIPYEVFMRTVFSFELNPIGHRFCFINYRTWKTLDRSLASIVLSTH